jgi:hypothetical protein
MEDYEKNVTRLQPLAYLRRSFAQQIKLILIDAIPYPML